MEGQTTLVGQPYKSVMQIYFLVVFSSRQRDSLALNSSQGLRVGLHIPTILGENSHLLLVYGRVAIKDPAHIGTSKGIAQAINSGPIRNIQPKYANAYVTSHSHGLSAGAWSYYATAKGRHQNSLAAAPISSSHLQPTYMGKTVHSY